MRAQFGAPVHDLHFTGPDQILTSGLGTKAFPKKELINFRPLWWFNRATATIPCPTRWKPCACQDRAGAPNKGVAQPSSSPP